MQTSTFKTVKAAILGTADLVDEDIKNIEESIQGKGIDIADLYFQIHRQETWVMEDGKIKEGAFSLDKGVGVRAVSGDKTGFAYSDDLSIAAIKKAAQVTQSIARLGQSSSANISEISQISSRYPSIDPLISISEQKKIDLIKTINELARNEDSRVQQVNISLSSSQDMILIATADMPLVADIRHVLTTT